MHAVALHPWARRSALTASSDRALAWADHKTWIDGIDGAQFWKRGVGMSASTDFVTWGRDRQLLLYPDEHDDPASAYLPGVGNVGTELHGG
jgi:hypothetical protein